MVSCSSSRIVDKNPLLVRTHNVTVVRGKSPLFAGLSVCIRQSGHFALVGTNGIGKSSLLEVLAGYLRPVYSNDSSLLWEFEAENNHSPLVARKHIRLFSPHQQARYVQQNWQVTGRDIILSGFLNEALVYGTATTEQIEKVDKLADEAHVGVLLGKHLPALSQGQLRMLLLLRALVATPKLLLLDEPYDGLSEAWRATLTQLLHKATLKGTTIVLTAHRLNDIPEFIMHAVMLAGKKDICTQSISAHNELAHSIFARNEPAQRISAQNMCVQNFLAPAFGLIDNQVILAHNSHEIKSNQSACKNERNIPCNRNFCDKRFVYACDDFQSTTHAFHLFVRESSYGGRSISSLLPEHDESSRGEQKKIAYETLMQTKSAPMGSPHTRTGPQKLPQASSVPSVVGDALFDKRSLCERYCDFSISSCLNANTQCHVPSVQANLENGCVASVTGTVQKNVTSATIPTVQNTDKKKVVTVDTHLFSNNVLLSMHCVDVYVERAHILKNITWHMQTGENWIINGANGAGKSTLVRLLYGEEMAAFGGQILWCGRERLPLPIWRKHVGFVSDKLQYLYRYDISACEVVLSGRGGTIGLYDEFTEKEYARAMQLLAFFRLEAVAHTSHFALSSGLMRRVLLARAMMCSPALILLDEPCSALDAQSRSDFLTSLESLAAEGVQFVYVSHNVHDIPTCFTHELVLHEGEVAYAGKRNRES